MSDIEPLFINIDGPDGVGKGTLIEGILDSWDVENYGEVVSFYDPGIEEGHSLNKIREVVKQEELLPETELMLFYACRMELWGKITKALSEGKNVILDRGPISTEVYQCRIKGMSEMDAKLSNIFDMVQPNYSFILTLPFDQLTERLEGRFKTANPNSDKFKSNSEFRKKVWLEYHKMSLEGKYIGIDATGSPKDVLGEFYFQLNKPYKYP